MKCKIYYIDHLDQVQYRNKKHYQTLYLNTFLSYISLYHHGKDLIQRYLRIEEPFPSPLHDHARTARIYLSEHLGPDS